MADMTTDTELIRLEENYWRALKDRDVDAALHMTSDPCIVAGPQGVARIGKQTFVSMMTDQSWSLRDFDLSDVEVQHVCEDVAVVAYRVREQLIVDGAPVIVDAADTSTWVRDNDSWVCALHTESLLGDPFGRDRGPGQT